ncbi:MAG: phospho-N-acetylmuramoyl-pentapeptide-transferase [Bernardetiaceae bacterium]
MLYYLADYLQRTYNLPGASLFQYISFRAGMSVLLSLLISMFFGKHLIRLLQKMQAKEIVRDLGLRGENLKAGTPTMGGLLILAAILLPTLLFAKLHNVYILLLLGALIWMGGIGFLDDYIKTFRKNKKGLHGKFKVVGQVGLGLVVGLVMYSHEKIVVREFAKDLPHEQIETPYRDVKSLKTTIPFFKHNELSYDIFGEAFSPLVYVFVVIFIITAISNGANITDGLDGLAAGTSAIIALVLGILAYVSGNVIFSDYLDIMYIPNSGELMIFCTALFGACVGFLWYNAFPAQVFMGDTGSLALGAIIAVLAIVIRKELLIPLLCGIFIIENLSVIIQVFYFKYTKRKYGQGRRVFRMAPLHHHYQKLGMHEVKIVGRFLIMGLILGILTLVTLKIR